MIGAVQSTGDGDPPSRPDAGDAATVHQKAFPTPWLYRCEHCNDGSNWFGTDELVKSLMVIYCGPCRRPTTHKLIVDEEGAPDYF